MPSLVTSVTTCRNRLFFAIILLRFYRESSIQYTGHGGYTSQSGWRREQQYRCVPYSIHLTTLTASLPAEYEGKSRKMSSHFDGRLLLATTDTYFHQWNSRDDGRRTQIANRKVAFQTNTVSKFALTIERVTEWCRQRPLVLPIYSTRCSEFDASVSDRTFNLKHAIQIRLFRDAPYHQSGRTR